MSIKKYHKSENLFNAEKIVDDSNNASTYIYGDYLRFSTGANAMIINVNATSEGSYTISFDVFNATNDTNNLRFIASYDDGTTETTPNFIISGTERYRYTFTTDNNKKLLSFETMNTYSKVSYIALNTAMLNAGSTALPYEPYDPEVWHSVPCRKYGTETDAITTLPTTVIGDGTPISSYIIKGNMEQSGEPTPSSPIYPSECGERTENLFDKGNYNLIRANAGAGMNILYGNPTDTPYAVYIPVAGGETYSFYSQATLSSSCFTMETPAIGVSIVLNGANTFGNENVRTAPADAKYLVVFLEVASVTQDRLDSDLATLTVVKSSTAPTSYEPYGYKLPITLGSTTTNIYLGEVQSTRRVKKLVLTGEENWYFQSINSYGIANLRTTLPTKYANSSFGLSTHLPLQTTTISETETEGFHLSSTNILYIRIDETRASTVSELKAYLAQQYAAGTPVTVWYVLAEPETAVVNEPLRKIGDYVDIVSGTGLATSGTAQELDVGTTLEPSELDLTYHGWHEHEDTKFTT